MVDSHQNHSVDSIFATLLVAYIYVVDKQLLGTETVSAMRSRGIKSRICGLSANDIGEAFLAVGADFFLLKPLATKKEALIQDMRKVLNCED